MVKQTPRGKLDRELGSVAPAVTATRKPTRLRAADRRDAILEAAKALFLAEGYERATMRKIASQLGITPTTLYLHFPDKDSLLREISNKHFSFLKQKLSASLEGSALSLEEFSRMLDIYIEFGLSHPREYKLLFMTEVPDWVPSRQREPGVPIEPDDMGMESLAVLERQVIRLMESGLIRPGNPSVVAEAVWATAHGLVSLLITFPQFPWSERQELIERVRQLIIAGLRPDPH